MHIHPQTSHSPAPFSRILLGQALEHVIVQNCRLTVCWLFIPRRVQLVRAARLPMPLVLDDRIWLVLPTHPGRIGHGLRDKTKRKENMDFKTCHDTSLHRLRIRATGLLVRWSVFNVVLLSRSIWSGLDCSTGYTYARRMLALVEISGSFGYAQRR